MVSFDEYIQSQIGKPFQWGVNDCSTLLWNWLKIKYPNNQLRPLEYRSEREAIAFSKKYKWLDELSKEFEIEFIETDKPDNELVYISEERSIQSVHLAYNRFIYSFDKYLNLVRIPIFEPLKFIKCLQQYHF